MKVNNLNAYGYNILFSYINETSTLPIDLTEYKSVKSGEYKKLLKAYYKSYKSDGSAKQEEVIGQLFDESK